MLHTLILLLLSLFSTLLACSRGPTVDGLPSSDERPFVIEELTEVAPREQEKMGRGLMQVERPRDRPQSGPTILEDLGEVRLVREGKRNVLRTRDGSVIHDDVGQLLAYHKPWRMVFMIARGTNSLTAFNLETSEEMVTQFPRGKPLDVVSSPSDGAVWIVGEHAYSRLAVPPKSPVELEHELPRLAVKLVRTLEAQQDGSLHVYLKVEDGTHVTTFAIRPGEAPVRDDEIQPPGAKSSQPEAAPEKVVGGVRVRVEGSSNRVTKLQQLDEWLFVAGYDVRLEEETLVLIAQPGRPDFPRDGIEDARTMSPVHLVHLPTRRVERVEPDGCPHLHHAGFALIHDQPTATLRCSKELGLISPDDGSIVWTPNGQIPLPSPVIWRGSIGDMRAGKLYLPRTGKTLDASDHLVLPTGLLVNESSHDAWIIDASEEKRHHIGRLECPFFTELISDWSGPEIDGFVCGTLEVIRHSDYTETVIDPKSTWIVDHRERRIWKSTKYRPLSFSEEEMLLVPLVPFSSMDQTASSLPTFVAARGDAETK